MPIAPTSFILELLYDFTDHPQVSQTPHLWGEPAEVVQEDEDAFTVVDGDSFTLNCASSVYNNTKHPMWYIQNRTVHNSTGCLLAILFHSALLSVIYSQCILILFDHLL